MNYPIPILLYHRIDEAGLSTSTSPRVFRQHMELLKEYGWRSLSAQEFASLASSGRPGPERSFLITFDDGYESIRSVAFDVLRELDFKAIGFLSTRFLRDAAGENAMVSPNEKNENADQYLSWRQVRELQASGVIDCQSHTHSHTNFTGCSIDGIRHDLGMSVDMLSHELRLPPAYFSHLAWPWGLSDPSWRKAAADAGFTYQYGVSRQAFRRNVAGEPIPRTCFDATMFSRFRRQLWMQTGSLSPLWEAAYPFGKRLRHLLEPVANLVKQT